MVLDSIVDCVMKISLHRECMEKGLGLAVYSGMRFTT